MLDLNLFGARLRALRKERHLVLNDIAKQLGITRTQISDLENGKTATTMQKLVVLAEFYHVSTDYLLGITDDPTWRGK